MSLISIGIVIMIDSNYNFFNDPSNFMYISVIFPLLEVLYRIFRSLSKLLRIWRKKQSTPQKSFPMTLKLDNYLTQNLNIFQGRLIRGIHIE
jgi:hypothetical protein